MNQELQSLLSQIQKNYTQHYDSSKHINHKFSTGDIYYQKNTSFQTLLTGSKVLHTGTIINIPGIPEPLILESEPSSKAIDLLSGKIKSGVHLIPLSQKLLEYKTTNTSIHIRTINQNEEVDTKNILSFLSKVHSKSYASPAENFIAGSPLKTIEHFVKDDPNTKFCTELTVNSLIAFNLASTTESPRLITPFELIEKQIVHLKRPNTYNPDVVLKERDPKFTDILYTLGNKLLKVITSPILVIDKLIQFGKNLFTSNDTNVNKKPNLESNIKSFSNDNKNIIAKTPSKITIPNNKTPKQLFIKLAQEKGIDQKNTNDSSSNNNINTFSRSLT